MDCGNQGEPELQGNLTSRSEVPRAERRPVFCCCFSPICPHFRWNQGRRLPLLGTFPSSQKEGLARSYPWGRGPSGFTWGVRKNDLFSEPRVLTWEVEDLELAFRSSLYGTWLRSHGSWRGEDPDSNLGPLLPKQIFSFYFGELLLLMTTPCSSLDVFPGSKCGFLKDPRRPYQIFMIHSHLPSNTISRL